MAFPYSPKRRFKRRTLRASTRTKRAVAFNEHPSAKCSATATAFLSLTLRIPQGCLLPFAELFATYLTAQVVDLIFAVDLTHSQILLAGLPVQFAALVDIC